MPLPASVHWQARDWVVVYRVSETHVWMADPATGHRKVKCAAFEAGWSGYAALFDYPEAFELAPEAQTSAAWVLPFFARHQGLLLQAFLLAVVASLFQLLLPIATQVVIDQMIVDRQPDLLRQVFLGMGAALVGLVASNLLQH